MSTPALQITVTAPIASFRNPLFAGVQVGLPCPPPATVGGMLAAARGGWHRVHPQTRFAMAFHAAARGVDLETYHPLDASGKKADPTPRDREFLADITLTIWLMDDTRDWWAALRRPVWPLRLGRSQDLVGLQLQTVELTPGAGSLGRAIVPAAYTMAGTMLQLPTAIALDRSRTRWDTYRYSPTGAADRIGGQQPDSWANADDQAIIFLPSSHPVHAGRRP